MTRYAEVAVDAPLGHSRTFSYSIPPRFRVEPGQLVWVPFGRRTLQGVVMELVAAPQVDVTRDIIQTVEPGRLLDDRSLTLARWLSRYYFSSLFDCLGSLSSRPASRARYGRRFFPFPWTGPTRENLKPASREALAALAEQRRMSEADFAKLLGRSGMRELNRLVDQGFVHRRVDLPRPRTFRYDSRLFPTGSPDALGNWPQQVTSRFVPGRKGCWQAVRECQGGYSTTQANREFGQGVGDALVEKGLLALEWVRQESRVVEAPPLPDVEWDVVEGQEAPLRLTSAQTDALKPIVAALESPAQQPRSFLLHGVTGSGKTEVYLRAIARAVERGRKALFLVPEIALTPQTVQRVNARFPGRVAVTHSGLTDRQRFDQWWQIRDGDYDVVIGPRSALSSPLPDLGLIVIDEEHEWTYKQSDTHPFYHARTAALELARMTGAVVVMGSATPDVETYYLARQGHHRLLELPHRIPYGYRPAPRTGGAYSGQRQRRG